MVAIFWDCAETTPLSLNWTGYDIVNIIREVAHTFGSVRFFKAYLDFSQQPSSPTFRSQLQSSGVSLTDCPLNGRKDVAGKMLLVDLLTYAMDHPPPATFVLISGDGDLAYAISTLRLLQYSVVVIAPSLPNQHNVLKSHASVFYDWHRDIIGRIQATPTDRNGRSNPSPHYLLPSSESGITHSTTPTTTAPKINDQLFNKAEGIQFLEESSGDNQPSRFYSSYSPASSTAPASMISNRGESIESQFQLGSRIDSSLSPGDRDFPQSRLVSQGSSTHVNQTQQPMDIRLHDHAPSTNTSSALKEQPLIDICDTTSPALSVNGEWGTNIIPFRACMDFKNQPNRQDHMNNPPASAPASLDFSFATPRSTLSLSCEPVILSGQKLKVNTTSTSPTISVIKALPTANSGAAVRPVLGQPTVFPSTKVATALTPAPSLNQQVPPPPVPSSRNLPSWRSNNLAGAPDVSPDRQPVSPVFAALVGLLEEECRIGNPRASRSKVAIALVKRDNMVYERAGVKKFGEYTAIAEKAGIIQLGGQGGDAWISLTSAVQFSFPPRGPDTSSINPDRSTPIVATTRPPIGHISSSTAAGAVSPMGISKTLASQKPEIGVPPSSIVPSSSKPPPALTSLNNRSQTSNVTHIPEMFVVLVELLRKENASGVVPLRSKVAYTLIQRDKEVYKRAGVEKFSQYAALAEKYGIIQMGGKNGRAWISLATP